MKVIIWGAANAGKAVFYSFSKNWEVVCFVDKNEALYGKTVCGKPVKGIEALHTEDYNAVIIANTYGHEITEFLNQHFPDKKVLDFLHEGLFDPRICIFNLLADEIVENNIEGSVAEAGVYKGDFTFYLNARFSNKKLYLFDTFEGFSEFDMQEDEKLHLSKDNNRLFKDAAVHIVQQKLIYPKNVIFKKGYFPQTTKGLEQEIYCFVSIDFDLYRPTLAAIRYFYTHLEKGGYIMLHDYHNNDFLGVKKAVKELQSELGFSYVPIQDGGGSIVLCK